MTYRKSNHSLYIQAYLFFVSLVDVKSCYESPFLILAEPVQGSSMYTVAFQVDDNGREILIALARASGLSGNYPACSTCTYVGDDGLLQGFRAEVYGRVTDVSSIPPILTVTSASVSNGRTASDICVLQQSSDPPSKAPQSLSPVITPAAIIQPTARPITTNPVITTQPTLNQDEEDSFLPTLGSPSVEPFSGDASEQPSQTEMLSPSNAPQFVSSTVAPIPVATSITIPSPNISTVPSNTTTNAAPTPTNVASQSDDANNRSSAGGYYNKYLYNNYAVITVQFMLAGSIVCYL